LTVRVRETLALSAARSVVGGNQADQREPISIGGTTVIVAETEIDIRKTDGSFSI